MGFWGFENNLLTGVIRTPHSLQFLNSNYSCLTYSFTDFSDCSSPLELGLLTACEKVCLKVMVL